MIFDQLKSKRKKFWYERGVSKRGLSRAIASYQQPKFYICSVSTSITSILTSKTIQVVFPCFILNFRSSTTRSMAREFEESHKKKKLRPSKIKTCVFLVLNSTGLFKDQRDRTKITEMCLLAVRRNDLHIGSRYPKVVSEIRLFFNPVEKISDDATRLSGLTSEMLKEQPQFGANTVSTINSFLGHLPPPVCLVSHYGYGFAFPLLKAEVRKCGKSLLEGVFCADSLPVYQEKHPCLPSYKLENIYSSLVDEGSGRFRNARGRCRSAIKCAQKTSKFAKCIDENKTLL